MAGNVYSKICVLVLKMVVYSGIIRPLSLISNTFITGLHLTLTLIVVISKVIT